MSLETISFTGGINLRNVSLLTIMKRVLKDISFKVNEGEMVALVGNQEVVKPQLQISSTILYDDEGSIDRWNKY